MPPMKRELFARVDISKELAMSFFNSISFADGAERQTTQTARGHIRPGGIRGATGLSRAALREVFNEIGLFATTSALTQEQQAVVLQRIGHLPGLKAAPIASVTSGPQARALSAYTAALMLDLGGASQAAVSKIRQAGLSRVQISEVEGAVRNAGEVFGPFPLSTLEAARIATFDAAGYALAG